MMRKYISIILPLTLFVFVTSVAAQTPPPPKPQDPPRPPQPVVYPCPQINVQVANPRIMRDGEHVVFAANVGGGDPNAQAIFNWSVSSGSIINGQGTRNITVDSKGSGNDRQIVADLLISGYSYECNVRATATVQVAAPPKKVDEFGELPMVDEEGKLMSIVNYIATAPDRVHIIGYAGRNNVRGYTSDVLRRMKAFITKSGPGSERVIPVDGGFREQPFFEIWVVPVGSESPRPTPTIDRKDIVYPKPPPRTPAPKTPVKKP